MFNTIKFLNDYNIPYQTQGKNSGGDFINITCPFCEDKSFHLGVHINKGFGNCWRCNWHSIESVINKLLPYEDSKNILKKYDTNVKYYDEIHKKLNKNNTKIKLPGYKLTNFHKNYLKRRGFDPDYLEKKYNIKGTLHIGNYRYRLIIPIYQNNELVTYQTRAINENETRYINCDPENEIIPIKECLYNIDQCNNDYVIVTEGCFKVFKLGDNSCACLGKNYSQKQLQLLVDKFKIVFIFFDPDIYGQEKAKKICNELNNLGVECYNIDHDKPPDNLNNKEVEIVLKEIQNFVKEKL